jgi:Cu-Zn family superoxide dismutase
VKITGELRGLTAGLHGLHVHQFGDVTNGVASVGVHFNPTNRTHGGPEDEERHAGDLGNINANEEGLARFDLTDKVIRLNGQYSIIGRSLVVDTDPDDLGTGN